MRTICLYFQVHQPFRFRRYRFFDIGNDHYYYDDFSNESKNRNLKNKIFATKEHRDSFFEWIERNASKIDYIFHIGARTDTTESDKRVFDRLNFGYSKKIWLACTEYGIPLQDRQLLMKEYSMYKEAAESYGDEGETSLYFQPLKMY